MAALLRCFRSPPPPPPPELSGGSLTSVNLMFLPFHKKKVVVPLKSENVSFVKGLNLPSNGPKFSERGIFPMSMLADTYDDRKLSGFCFGFLKHIYDHQLIGSSSFARTFVLANTLMLILPLEAMAETCVPENSLLKMPLLFGIALIGATVGGLLARQRRGELERLNDQLRQINAALRRQAKIESYAPDLSYAPPVARVAQTEVIVDPRKEEIITKLRTGKNYLRNRELEKAFTEFKAALELARALGDHVEEKKAARGLGASLQRQGKYRDAIKYHSCVLEISERTGEDSGATEAYGAIADCYTELGDLERAAAFYDKYIARLESD